MCCAGSWQNSDLSFHIAERKKAVGDAIGFNGLHGTGGMMTDAELGFRSPPIEREPVQYAGDQDGSDTDPDG